MRALGMRGSARNASLGQESWAWCSKFHQGHVVQEVTKLTFNAAGSLQDSRKRNQRGEELRESKGPPRIL